MLYELHGKLVVDNILRHVSDLPGLTPQHERQYAHFSHRDDHLPKDDPAGLALFRQNVGGRYLRHPTDSNLSKWVDETVHDAKICPHCRLRSDLVQLNAVTQSQLAVSSEPGQNIDLRERCQRLMSFTELFFGVDQSQFRVCYWFLEVSKSSSR